MHARGKDYPANWWKALGGLLIAHGTIMKSIYSTSFTCWLKQGINDGLSLCCLLMSKTSCKKNNLFLFSMK
jgi:hypothetical protein